jgi:hypothetical protein
MKKRHREANSRHSHFRFARGFYGHGAANSSGLLPNTMPPLAQQMISRRNDYQPIVPNGIKAARQARLVAQ